MSKTEKSDLAGMFKRLPSGELKKLVALVNAEMEKRKGKDVSGMTDAEFRKYVDEQFAAADRAAREADVRRMLGSKDESKDKPQSKDQKEGKADNE
jgi:hypothetical protein